MAGVVKHIIGSFEDIGKDIAREAIRVPKDIVGKALESMGTNTQTSPKTPIPQKTTSEEKKPVPPRVWLQELAGKGRKQTEPTIQEIHKKEDREKNEKENKQAVAAQKMAPIITGSSKPKRGNLYGVKQKASSEMSKNVRQD